MDLQITGYKPQPISLGGYSISRKPDPVPAGCRLLLGASTNTQDQIDVTHAPARDMIHNRINMLSLLRVFQFHGWPRKLDFRLFQTQGGRVQASSERPQEINGPVEPHTGPLLPLDGRWRSVYKYLFNERGYHEPDGHSRALAEVPGMGLFWTDIGDKFETNPAHRGFSCVGYVAAVCGVRSATFWGTRGQTALGTLDGIDGVTSADLLKYLGETGVRMWLRDRPADEVVSFFRGGKPGYFIVWRQGQHTTMVIGQTVHEFNYGGYKESHLEPRVKKKADGWSVAQLLTKPALAA